MAHRITDTDTMFSVGTRPWHGLGSVIDAAPTIADAIALAGLDWRVELEPNFTYLDGAWVATPSQSVVKVSRLADGSDFREVLGSVGPAYTPLQNEDAFAWFQPWLDAGVASLETAGSLDGQRRVWVLARITRDPIVVAGDDEVTAHVLLAHAHDGSLAVRAGLTPIRVVCSNTLSAAIAGGKVESMFRISHTSGMRSRLADAATAIEVIDQRLRGLTEVYQELSRATVKPGDLLDYVAAAYGQTPEDAAKGRRIAPITELFEGGTGQDLPAAKGTVWGLYNALTEFVTHRAGRGSDGDANARRHFGSVMGDGARVLARGLDAALVLARRSYTLESVFGDHAQIVTDATAAHPDALILPARLG